METFRIFVVFLSVSSVASALPAEGCPQSDECIAEAFDVNDEENVAKTMLIQMGLEVQKASHAGAPLKVSSAASNAKSALQANESPASLSVEAKSGSSKVAGREGKGKAKGKPDEGEAADGDAENAAGGEEENAANGNGENAAGGEEENAAQGEGENAAGGQEENAANGEGENAAGGEEENAANGEGENAAGGEEENTAGAQEEYASPEQREEHHGLYHNDHGHKASPVDMALGGSLLAMLCFIMGLFYITNSQDHDIRKVANFSISNTISIFASVLAYGCLGMWLDHIWSSQTLVTPKMAAILGSFLTFFVLLVLVCAIMRALKDRLNIQFVRILGAHLVGFAAAEAFATVQQEPPFGKNLFYDLCVAGICLVFFFVLETTFLKIALPGSDEQREEFADEFFAFCVGFLLAQFAKMTVLGHLTPIHGQPKDHSHKEVKLLGLWLAATFVVLVIAAMIKEKAHHQNWPKFAKRWSSFGQTLGCFCFAWIGLFSTQWSWFLMFPGQTVAFGKMVLAIVDSIIAMGAIYVLDGAVDMGAPKALRTIITGLAILVGLLWEQAFHEAIRGLSSGFPEEKSEISTTLMTLGIIIIVLPAWRWYILPRASEEEEFRLEETRIKVERALSPVRYPQEPVVATNARFVAMPRSAVIPPSAAFGSVIPPTTIIPPTSTSLSYPTINPRY